MTIMEASAAPAASRLGSIARAFARRIAAWQLKRQEQQRQLVALDGMSNHLRRDIGLPPKPMVPIDLCLGTHTHNHRR